MKYMITSSVAFFSAFLIYGSGLARTADTRIALLIGNQAYTTDLGKLYNPVKDIKIVGAALKNAGFEVQYLENANRSDILFAVETYAKKIGQGNGDDIGFLYYSGHGAAKSGTNDNFLVPVSVKSPNDRDFWYQSVNLEEIKSLLNEYARQASHIVVFDACRTELKLGRGGKGFVPVRDWGGMFVAFSTRQNEIASDGDPQAAAGPYAMALAEEIGRSRQDLVPVVFERVRANFRERSTDDQFPYFSQGLTKSVLLDGISSTRSTANLNAQCPRQLATDLWSVLRQTQSTGLLSEFVKYCPGTAEVDLARARLRPLGQNDGAGSAPPVNANTGLEPLILALDSENTNERRRARATLATTGLSVVEPLLRSLRPDGSKASYRTQLGSVVVLTEVLRKDKSLRGDLIKLLSVEDLKWLTQLATHSDRTLRVYASEFLYDLGDARVLPLALSTFQDASENGKYNLALIIKGAASFLEQADRSSVRERLEALKSDQSPKTNRLLDDALRLLPV